MPSEKLEYHQGMHHEALHGPPPSVQGAGLRAWLKKGLASIAILWPVMLAGCESRPVSYRAAIQSANPDERIRGIRAAAEAKDQHAVPLLVDRLEDEDEAVRFFAIIALGKITGQRFGYDYALPASQRAEAVERWREYLRRGSRTASSSGSSAAAHEPAGATTDAGVRGGMP
ncbi:MAG TPA: HEAT repeat domain-containing protein [Phycisphaerae bacterium]|nr:HEAT repeat domain-containing protein [Phycisphaerae bacterium]